VIAARTPRSCKLNPFQQVMALWEEVRPYNFAHVIRLRGPANPVLLHEAIQTACHVAGVGKLVLDREGRRYFYEPAESVQLCEMKSEDSSLEPFWRTIADELNRAFPAEPHHPVRWLVRDDPSSGSHYLVAIYRHLVADFASSCLLLRRILNRYYRMSTGDEKPLVVHPPNYSRVMRRHYWKRDFPTTFLQAVRRYLRLRHVYRLPELRDEGEGWQLHVLEAPHGLIRRLLAASIRRRVTVNEAFLAALCAALAEMTPHRRQHSRRRGLALAHMVNVRGEAREDLSNCFGVYLRESVTIIDEPDAEDFEVLLGRIVAEVRRERAGRRFGGLDWNFLVLARLRKWHLMKNTVAWYRKVYPLAAGLSNVRLSASWFTGISDRILDSISIVPPGPALPFVLFPTTVDDKLNLSFVYRESSFTQPEALKLIDLFVKKLEHFASSGRAGSCGLA